jgi:hypothetical protein
LSFAAHGGGGRGSPASPPRLRPERAESVPACDQRRELPERVSCRYRATPQAGRLAGPASRTPASPPPVGGHGRARRRTRSAQRGGRAGRGREPRRISCIVVCRRRGGDPRARRSGSRVELASVAMCRAVSRPGVGQLSLCLSARRDPMLRAHPPGAGRGSVRGRFEAAPAPGAGRGRARAAPARLAPACPRGAALAGHGAAGGEPRPSGPARVADATGGRARGQPAAGPSG